MKIEISDLLLIKGSSGNGARCSISISADHAVFGKLMQTTRGCLVFRDKYDRLAILTPVVFLNGRGGKKIKYRPILLSPGLHSWLSEAIEKNWGEFIVRNPDAILGVHPSRVNPSALDNYSETV